MELTNWLSNRHHARDARNMQVSVKWKMNGRQITRRWNWFELFVSFSLSLARTWSAHRKFFGKSKTMNNMEHVPVDKKFFSVCVNYGKLPDFLIALRLFLSSTPLRIFSVPPSVLLLLFMSHYRFSPCSWFLVVHFLCFSFLSIKFHFGLCTGPDWKNQKQHNCSSQKRLTNTHLQSEQQKRNMG